MGHIKEISLEQLEKMNCRKNNVDKNMRTLKKRDERAFTVQVWITQFACKANVGFDVSLASPENLTTILKSGDIIARLS